MAAKKETKPIEAIVSSEPSFTKQQILASKKYRHQTDLIGALLKDGTSYTIAKVDEMIKSYKERRM